jgi:Fibronectin type III domain
MYKYLSSPYSIYKLNHQFLCYVSSAAQPGLSKLRYGRVRKDTVTLEWEAPSEPDVSLGLSGYLIEKRELRKDTWTPVKKVTPKIRTYEVPGLLTGREYMFRVRPIGVHGYLGEAIMPESPVTIASQYSKK